MSLGKNIAYYRKSKGYTQEKLGEKLCVSNQAVSKWESETSMPDVMMLPRIAAALDVTLDTLFAEQTSSTPQTKQHTLNMAAVHDFPTSAQAIVFDTLCKQTNLTNCNSWDFLRAESDAFPKKHYQIKQFYTMCCLSDTAGAAFVSNALTVIDSRITPADISSIFDKPEVASAIRKLTDTNVRLVLSYVCKEYFQSLAPFDCNHPEYFTMYICPDDLSHSIGISAENIVDVLEKLIALHIVELETNHGTHYLLHKVKAIEAAVTLRLIERFIHNEAGFGCGDFFALMKH